MVLKQNGWKIREIVSAENPAFVLEGQAGMPGYEKGVKFFSFTTVDRSISVKGISGLLLCHNTNTLISIMPSNDNSASRPIMIWKRSLREPLAKPEPQST
jgi:hypothetical protein